MFYQNSKQVKAFARSLRSALATMGLDVPKGQVLDLLAKTRGFEDWNGYSASLSVESLNAMLRSGELKHYEDAADADIRAEETSQGGYENETVLQVHTGFFLKVPSYPEDCSYIRVCDSLHREIAYWNSEELAEAPEEVLGAIIGALARNQGITIKEAGVAPATPEVLRIQEVDFSKVHALKIQGEPFKVAWQEEETLALLSRFDTLSESEKETCYDDCALTLSYLDDDLLERTRELSLGVIASLRWSTTHRAFLAPTGDVFEFYVEMSLADSLGL